MLKLPHETVMNVAVSKPLSATHIKELVLMMQVIAKVDEEHPEHLTAVVPTREQVREAIISRADALERAHYPTPAFISTFALLASRCVGGTADGGGEGGDDGLSVPRTTPAPGATAATH